MRCFRPVMKWRWSFFIFFLLFISFLIEPFTSLIIDPVLRVCCLSLFFFLCFQFFFLFGCSYILWCWRPWSRGSLWYILLKISIHLTHRRWWTRLWLRLFFCLRFMTMNWWRLRMFIKLLDLFLLFVYWWLSVWIYNLFLFYMNRGPLMRYLWFLFWGILRVFMLRYLWTFLLRSLFRGTFSG